MMHKRRWSLSSVPSVEELASMLTERTWTLCSAFCVAGHEEYLFLNDSTHEDGAGEFAVLKHLPDGSYLQVESVTFSWCSREDAAGHIRKALAGECDGEDFVRRVHPRIDAAAEHRCHLCA